MCGGQRNDGTALSKKAHDEPRTHMRSWLRSFQRWSSLRGRLRTHRTRGTPVRRIAMSLVGVIVMEAFPAFAIPRMNAMMRLAFAMVLKRDSVA